MWGDQRVGQAALGSLWFLPVQWLGMASTTGAMAPPPWNPTWRWMWSQLVPLSEVTTLRGPPWWDRVVWGPPPHPPEPSLWPADVLEECDDVSQVQHRIPSPSHVLPTKINPSQWSAHPPPTVLAEVQSRTNYSLGGIVRWEQRSWSIMYRNRFIQRTWRICFALNRSMRSAFIVQSSRNWYLPKW